MEAKELVRVERQSLESRILERSWIDDYCRYLDRSKNTTITYTKNLRSFFAWLCMEGIRRPIREDVMEYRSWLLSAHYAIKLDLRTASGWSYQMNGSGQRMRIKCKPATVALYLRSVCAFFSWAELEGLYPNIAKGIHAPKIRNDFHKKDAMEPEEIRQLLQHMDSNPGSTRQEKEQRARIRAIILLAVTAGLRTIEISRATIGDLEIRGGRAWLYIWGKGHSEPDQRKALAKGTYEAIKAYLDLRQDPMRPDAPLFMATGNRSAGGPVLPTTISTWIKREMQAAGYDSERLTAHSLRHTAGTMAQRISGDLYLTQRYMRHSNPATTEIYLHTDTGAQEAGIADQLFLSFTEA